MISSARTLPLPAPAPERADLPSSPNSDSHSDSVALPFASHLEHFATPAHPQHDGLSAQRLAATLAQRPANHTAKNAPKTAKESADTQANSAPVSENTNVPTTDDANRSADKPIGIAKEDKKEDKDANTKEVGTEDANTVQDTQPAAAPAVSAVPLPLTTVNLAITNGVAPLPIPVPVPQTNDTETLPEAPSASTPTTASGTSLPINSLINSPINSLINPLNLPGVSMDSRSAVQTAAPGVVNALPQNFEVSAQVSLPVLPAQTPAKTSVTTNNAANTPAASAQATSPAPMNAPVTTSPAPMNAPVTTSPAPMNAPVTALNLTLPQATVPQSPAAARNTIGSAALNLTLPQATVPVTLTGSTAPVQQTTAQQVNTPKTTPSIPQTGSIAQETDNKITLPSPGAQEENSAEVSTTGISTTGISATEQNLGGIERLFTLGANKITDTRATQATEIETGKSDATAATPGAAVTLPAQNVSGKQQIPVSLTSQIHQMVAHDAAAASLAPVPSLASDQIPALLPPLATTALAASAALKSGALSQPIDAIRDANGTSALSATNSVTGANGMQIAPFGALGKTGGGTSADSESQTDSHHEEHEEAASSAAENKTDSTAQANSANPFNSLKATGETAAANAITASNGTSQTARAQIVEQVTRHLESMRISNGEGEMRLRLAPAHLGNVQISVATHPNGVVARIAVESAQIQQAMEGAKEHLRTSLEARGLQVHSVEVTVTPNQIGSGGAAFAGERNWQPTGERAETQTGSSRPNTTDQASEDSPDAVPTAIPATHVSHSRLDYRA